MSYKIPMQVTEIQLIYKNRITFWNAGQLAEAWTVADLLKEHPSIPYNPDIATAFFRAGLIEAWGRGALRTIERNLQKLQDEHLLKRVGGAKGGHWEVIEA